MESSVCENPVYPVLLWFYFRTDFSVCRVMSEENHEGDRVDRINKVC
jgi:hypothetical protein